MPKVHDLFTSELPREKIINNGPDYLTDVELLAVILRVGTKNKNILDLSREILKSFSVSQITRKTYYELLEFRGISKAKACQIVSVFELARRLNSQKITNKTKITDSLIVFNIVKSDFSNLEIEKVMIVFVDTKNQFIKKEFIFEGTINFSFIDIRKIIKNSLIIDASGFFLIHNHPTGILDPSQEDIEVTNNIQKICENLNLRFLDHLIVGNNDYFSMFDNDKF